MTVTVVKLGTSITAEDDGALRGDVLAAVCDEVAARPGTVIVTSGAIARGMRVMGLPARPGQIADLQAASAVGQGKLFRVYDELLRERGRTAAQVLLTFHDLRERMNYLNARQTLQRLLEWDVVPVINENDTTATDEISFGDNDFLAAQVAVLLGADRLVLLTNTDGLYTANPSTDPDARWSTQIHDPAELDALAIGHEPSALGTGGMRSKVVAAEMATAAGIPTTICNGLRPGALGRALAGEDEGTRFRPQAERTSSFKLWLKYAKPAHGRARRRRRRRPRAARGRHVAAAGRHHRGRAATSTPATRSRSSPTARSSARASRRSRRPSCGACSGKRSAEVRELLGAGEEAVHRDYFVLS